MVVPLDKLDDKVLSGFVKVGTRNSMEIAIVSLAYHILTDEDGIISASGVAVGSVAETVIFTQKACDFIKEKNTLQMTKSDREQFADGVVEYAAPISDMRASEWYRRQVLWNISSNVFNQ